MYADDFILLSAFVMDLQKMLNVCGSIGSILGIYFNSTKSKCIKIGPLSYCVPTPLLLSGNDISWVDKIKYLGIWICTNQSFTVDLAPIRRKFFISVTQY